MIQITKKQPNKSKLFLPPCSEKYLEEFCKRSGKLLENLWKIFKEQSGRSFC